MQKQAREKALKKIMSFASGMMGEKIKGRYPDSVSVTLQRKKEEEEEGDGMPTDPDKRRAELKKRLGLG